MLHIFSSQFDPEKSSGATTVTKDSSEKSTEKGEETRLLDFFDSSQTTPTDSTVNESSISTAIGQLQEKIDKSDKPLDCPQCDEKFDSDDSLRNHEKSHIDENTPDAEYELENHKKANLEEEKAFPCSHVRRVLNAKMT